VLIILRRTFTFGFSCLWLLSFPLWCFGDKPAGESRHPPSFDSFAVSEDVLPGYEPVLFQENEITVWNRTYRMNKCGWLDSVACGSRELLTGAMRIEGSIDKAPLAPDFLPGRVLEKGRRKVVLLFQGKQKNLHVRTVATFEYDGLVRYQIKLTSREMATFRDVAVRIPLNAKYMKYMHFVGDEIKGNCGSIAVPRGDGVVWGSGMATRYAASKGGSVKRIKIVNSFLPLIWLGDYRGGLCWFAESDKGWKDTKDKSIIEVERDAETVNLVIHIIMGADSRRELLIDFGLMCTPVKSLPPGWRGWKAVTHRGSGTRKTVNDLEASVNPAKEPAKYVPKGAERIYVYNMDGVGGLKRNRFTRHVFYPDILKREIDLCHARSWRYITYICMDFVSPARPGGIPNLARWHRVPDYYEKHIMEKYRQTRKVSLQNRENLADILRLAEQLIGQYDVDGLYLDDTFMKCSLNLEAGECYKRPDGRLQPIFKIYQYREFMEKLANIFVRHNKEPFIYLHNTNMFLIPAFSFATASFGGEIIHLSNYAKDYLDIFPEAKAVVEFSGRPWGLAPNIIFEPINYDRYKKLNPKPTLTEAQLNRNFADSLIALSLLHDSVIGPGWPTHAKHFKPIDEAKYRFDVADDSVRFFPYWRDDDSVTTGSKDVKVSYYLGKNGVLLAACNYGPEEVQATCRLSSRIMAVMNGNVFTDALSGERITVTDGSLSIKMTSRGYRILVYDSRER